MKPTSEISKNIEILIIENSNAEKNNCYLFEMLKERLSFNSSPPTIELQLSGFTNVFYEKLGLLFQIQFINSELRINTNIKTSANCLSFKGQKEKSLDFITGLHVAFELFNSIPQKEMSNIFKSIKKNNSIINKTNKNIIKLKIELSKINHLEDINFINEFLPKNNNFSIFAYLCKLYNVEESQFLNIEDLIRSFNIKYHSKLYTYEVCKEHTNEIEFKEYNLFFYPNGTFGINSDRATYTSEKTINKLLGNSFNYGNNQQSLLEFPFLNDVTLGMQSITIPINELAKNIKRI